MHGLGITNWKCTCCLAAVARSQHYRNQEQQRSSHCYKQRPHALLSRLILEISNINEEDCIPSVAGVYRGCARHGADLCWISRSTSLYQTDKALTRGAGNDLVQAWIAEGIHHPGNAVSAVAACVEKAKRTIGLLRTARLIFDDCPLTWQVVGPFQGSS